MAMLKNRNLTITTAIMMALAGMPIKPTIHKIDTKTQDKKDAIANMNKAAAKRLRKQARNKQLSK